MKIEIGSWLGAALDQARGASPAGGMSHQGLNGLSAMHNYGQDGELLHSLLFYPGSDTVTVSTNPAFPVKLYNFS